MRRVCCDEPGLVINTERRPLCCQVVLSEFAEAVAGVRGRPGAVGRRLGCGPGVACPKSRRPGCEPAALETEPFPDCPPGPLACAGAWRAASAWSRGVDDVAELAFERAERFLAGFALGDLVRSAAYSASKASAHIAARRRLRSRSARRASSGWRVSPRSARAWRRHRAAGWTGPGRLRRGRPGLAHVQGGR